LGPGRNNRAEAVHRSTNSILISLSLSSRFSFPIRFESSVGTGSLNPIVANNKRSDARDKNGSSLSVGVDVCARLAATCQWIEPRSAEGWSEEAEFRESREAVQALSTARTHERAPRTTHHTPHTASSLRIGPILWCPGGRRWGLLLLDMDSGVQYCKWLQSNLCIDVSGERQRRTQSRSEITCRGGPQTVIYLLPATRTMYTKSTDG
jgi:hypothetical protein